MEQRQEYYSFPVTNGKKRGVNPITKKDLPNWTLDGRKAGPLRNEIMVKTAVNLGVPVSLIAFHYEDQYVGSGTETTKICREILSYRK